MLLPPKGLSFRLATGAVLLFFALFLYHTSRSQESWISSSAPQAPVLQADEPGAATGAAASQSLLATQVSQDRTSTQPLVPTQLSLQPLAPTQVAQEGDVLPTSVVSDAPEDPPAPNAPTDAPTDDIPADSVDGVIVIGKLQEEYTDWVAEKLPKYVSSPMLIPALLTVFRWKNAIYIVDNQSAPLHTPINKGREATPYLTYIIENYHHLPRTLVFLHSHESGYPGGWHTDTPEHSNVWSVEHLNLDFVHQTGYVNLRCTHIPGCPDEIQPFRDPFDASRASENHMPEAWAALFGNPDVPHVIGAACCAQFAVSRDRVLERPLDDYVRFRDWVLNTPLEDDLSGRILEYLWHVIFGKPPVE
ncbi:hypothetical protein BK809_0003373 [Diplodia seriata]|uniref:Uncharacterized protein n=1 Tax=Diplodia seriata TaxID=420778 RepID=A0A1S8BFZ0_9PEZI|nr:hypothetical protein BK809_0003373 [Diplodia seriata]